MYSVSHLTRFIYSILFLIINLHLFSCLQHNILNQNKITINSLRMLFIHSCYVFQPIIDLVKFNEQSHVNVNYNKIDTIYNMLETFVFSTRAFNSAIIKHKFTFLLFCSIQHIWLLNDFFLFVFIVFINKKNEGLKLKYILYL